jgi:hypothetical protein
MSKFLQQSQQRAPISLAYIEKSLSVGVMNGNGPDPKLFQN